MPAATASQTIGPYWHLIEHKEWADLTRFGAEGERIEVAGRITDGAGDAVVDAAVEIWQASPPADERFPGYGRSATDAEGRFRFVTLKPEAVPGNGNQTQAPHLSVVLLARGLMTALRHPHLLPGRDVERDRPAAGLDRGSGRAGHADREAGRAPAPGTSTSACRAKARRSSSRSDARHPSRRGTHDAAAEVDRHRLPQRHPAGQAGGRGRWPASTASRSSRTTC